MGVVMAMVGMVLGGGLGADDHRHGLLADVGCLLVSLLRGVVVVLAVVLNLMLPS